MIPLIKLQYITTIIECFVTVGCPDNLIFRYNIIESLLGKSKKEVVRAPFAIYSGPKRVRYPPRIWFGCEFGDVPPPCGNSIPNFFKGAS